MAFYVGQKVVCVDASDSIPGVTHWGADPPVEGMIYTVAGMTTDAIGRQALLLFEIRNTATHNGGYRAARFRPVTERKTDISIFKAMLNPSREEVSA